MKTLPSRWGQSWAQHPDPRPHTLSPRSSTALVPNSRGTTATASSVHATRLRSVASSPNGLVRLGAVTAACEPSAEPDRLADHPASPASCCPTPAPDGVVIKLWITRRESRARAVGNAKSAIHKTFADCERRPVNHRNSTQIGDASQVGRNAKTRRAARAPALWITGG
jgi:hypothetical protein